MFLERARKRSKVHLVDMVSLVDKQEESAGFPNQKTLTKFIVDVSKFDAKEYFSGFVRPLRLRLGICQLDMVGRVQGHAPRAKLGEQLDAKMNEIAQSNCVHMLLCQC